MFADNVLLPLSNDAAYHVRRILRLSQELRYPGLFDPLFNWPHGAATHWSPGFDYIAAIVATFLGGDDPRQVAHAAALLPAVYGVIGVVVVGHLSTRVLDKRDGFVWATAALFVALVPQSIAISRLGFVDHHVTELLFVALLWRWTVAATELAEAEASLKQRVRFEVVGALLLTASVWVQSVGLLYTGIATFALLMLVCVRQPSTLPVSRGLMGTGGPALCFSAILLTLLYVPAVREHGHAYAYEYPSYFQPLLLAIGGLTVAMAWLLVREVRRRDQRAWGSLPRIGALLLVIIVGLAALFALTPAVRSAVSGLFQLAASKGPDLAKIEELQPLLSEFSAIDGTRWGRLDAYFGWAGRAFFVLLPVGLLAARRAGRERWVGTVVWVLAIVGLSLSQSRWSRVLVVPMAVLSAAALPFLADWVLRAASRLRSRNEDRSQSGYPRGAGGIAFVTAAGLLVAPDPMATFATPPPSAPAVFEAGLFLRGAAEGSVEPGQRRGLLAPWHHGFQLLHASGLPLLSTGHAWLVGEDGYRLERAAWSGSATALWALMEKRDLGFVVAGVDNLAKAKLDTGEQTIVREPGAPAINWDYFKAVPLGVMVLGGTGLPELGVRHLEHLCQRFTSSEFLPLQVPVPRLWVFEWVPGAILEGTAVPGSRVVAELRLRHAAGVVPYIAYADADERGLFTMRFPVPTLMKTNSLQSAKAIRIKRRGQVVTTLELSEKAVRSGAKVIVPGGVAITGSR